MSAHTEAPTDAAVDAQLDAILRASGSALRHYSMHKTISDMRAALRSAVAALSLPDPSAAPVDLREIECPPDPDAVGRALGGCGWVAVADRLPDAHCLCLALLSHQVHVLSFNPSTMTQWWNAYGMPQPTATNPTHWMPLPTAPQQGEQT